MAHLTVTRPCAEPNAPTPDVPNSEARELHVRRKHEVNSRTWDVRRGLPRAQITFRSAQTRQFVRISVLDHHIAGTHGV